MPRKRTEGLTDREAEIMAVLCLFSGSTEELLVRLIDEGAVDSAQLERLQKRLRKRRDQGE